MAVCASNTLSRNCPSYLPADSYLFLDGQAHEGELHPGPADYLKRFLRFTQEAAITWKKARAAISGSRSLSWGRAEAEPGSDSELRSG